MPFPSLLDSMSLDNPVFRNYILCNSILTLKVMAMVPLTARQRKRKGESLKVSGIQKYIDVNGMTHLSGLQGLNEVVISPEDTTLFKGAKFGLQDPDVERVRRAHFNDLENIPLFTVAAFGYLITNPEPQLAINLMRLYTAARVVHSLVYAVVVVPQPARAIAFFVGYGITGYMAVTTIIKLFQ